jgi:prevent-host-death family protein
MKHEALPVDKPINMHEAKSRLSQLVEAIESGAETEITIARNGKPVAMLVPIPVRKPVRLGLARGKYKIPDNIDRDNDLIARMFYGEEE